MSGKLHSKLFDHLLLANELGTTTSISVVHASPYLKDVQSVFGDSLADFQESVQSTAADLGLRVRIGHPGDIIHVSASNHDWTVPVVWWNPARFRLPAPKLFDPYQLFSAQIVEMQKEADKAKRASEFLAKKHQESK